MRSSWSRRPEGHQSDHSEPPARRDSRKRAAVLVNNDRPGLAEFADVGRLVPLPDFEGIQRREWPGSPTTTSRPPAVQRPRAATAAWSTPRRATLARRFTASLSTARKTPQSVSLSSATSCCYESSGAAAYYAIAVASASGTTLDLVHTGNSVLGTWTEGLYKNVQGGTINDNGAGT